VSLRKPWETGRDRQKERAVADANTPPWEPPLIHPPDELVDEHDALTKEKGVSVDLVKAQAFAQQYLIDFNATAASQRAFGITTINYAAKVGSTFLAHPFTVSAIQRYMATIDEKTIVTRNRVLFGLLREAEYYGHGATHAARVAAWGKLAKIVGLELPPEDPNAQKDTGVMTIGPAKSPDAWEAVAKGQQEGLKRDVRA
jgi:hypothetical protein